MSTRHTVLLAMLIPSLALLSACNRHDADDAAATAAAADTTAAPADTMPAEPMPADNSMPAASAATDSMASPTMGDAMSFADLDKNHDGSVSKDELAAGDMLMQHFSVADADANGMLSEAEVAKHRADMAAAPAQ